MPHLTIQVDDPASAEARELVEQLDRQMSDLYPPESNHLLPVEALRHSSVTFLTAWVNGQIAGCGAFVCQEREYVEIKRIFVLPKFRGLRIGRGILAELERRARAAGLELARLETGVSQPEALRLFEAAGYERRGPFGEYVEDPLSVFMEKKLE
jgi:putative acetyltransferase